jgi:preprotein translocase subunit SecD
MKFRSVVIYVLVAVFLAGVLMQAQGALEIRAASTTAIAGWQQMAAPGGGSVWVSPSSALTSADIARGEPRTDAKGQRTVGVVFTADGARKMAQLSAAQANRPIAMLLDGKLVWAPTVRGTIEKEAVLSGVTPDVVQRVLTSLKQ